MPLPIATVRRWTHAAGRRAQRWSALQPYQLEAAIARAACLVVVGGHRLRHAGTAYVLPDGTHDLDFGRAGFGYADSDLTVGPLAGLVGGHAVRGRPGARRRRRERPVRRGRGTHRHRPALRLSAATASATGLPPRRADGSRVGAAIFNAMAFDADGTGLRVGGSTLDDAASGTHMFDTLHVCIAVECRRLFGDGPEVMRHDAASTVRRGDAW